MEIAERISPFTPEWIRSGGEHLCRYRYAGQYVQGKRVLDVGCGIGYGSYLLSDSGAEFVLGIDWDQDCIKKAKKVFKKNNLEYVVDDAQALTNTKNYNNFDIVVSFENIEHLPKPDVFLNKCVQLLHPEGMLIVSTPNGATSWKNSNGAPLNPYHPSEMTEEEFQTLLSKYFEIVKIQYQIMTLEGLRAQRLNHIISHIGTSKTFKFEQFLRKIFRKTPLSTDLNIHAESDFEITSKPFWDSHIFAFVAIAKGPKV